MYVLGATGSAIMVMEIKWLHALSPGFEEPGRVWGVWSHLFPPLLSDFPSWCNSLDCCIPSSYKGEKKIQLVSGANFTFHSLVIQSECNTQSNYATISKCHCDIWGNAALHTGWLGSCQAELCHQQWVRSKHSPTFNSAGEQGFPEPRWDAMVKKCRSDMKAPFISGQSFNKT